LNVAVTVVSLSIRRTQVEVPVQPPPDQPPKVEGAIAVAVRVTVVPAGKLSTQLIAVLAQLKVGLVTVPVPLPRKLTVKIGAAPPPPPPVSVKQTTLAVMEPVTTAPEEDTPDPSAFVVTVAETRVFGPQTTPVTVISPVELTVTSWVSLDAQVTWLVISLVTGG